jgi:hypothetical protein
LPRLQRRLCTALVCLALALGVFDASVARPEAREYRSFGEWGRDMQDGARQTGQGIRSFFSNMGQTFRGEREPRKAPAGSYDRPAGEPTAPPAAPERR